ncbi:DUF3465 domain-containing protein [Methylotenera sp. L2L1]|uniref:DUF3465 domain-containing protein n=1 Tax=Methylotenera sp. L2L1 TaxID=1502770 RepID=UPI000562BB82|nr:DUF3465 domain-containing protein [Methylotenera sp. L2L1]
MRVDATHWLVALGLAFTLCACNQPNASSTQQLQVTEHTDPTAASNASIEQAFAAKLSDVQVTGTGVIVKLLPDDNKDAKHQKFLVKINAKQTLLFAHNIDIAPRVPVQVGDTISFNGEYVYNPKGGVIHWTHHAPRADHEAGWVMHNNQKYQ